MNLGLDAATQKIIEKKIKKNFKIESFCDVFLIFFILHEALKMLVIWFNEIQGRTVALSI